MEKGVNHFGIHWKLSSDQLHRTTAPTWTGFVSRYPPATHFGLLSFTPYAAEFSMNIYSSSWRALSQTSIIAASWYFSSVACSFMMASTLTCQLPEIALILLAVSLSLSQLGFQGFRGQVGISEYSLHKCPTQQQPYSCPA